MKQLKQQMVSMMTKKLMMMVVLVMAELHEAQSELVDEEVQVEARKESDESTIAQSDSKHLESYEGSLDQMKMKDSRVSSTS